MTFVPRSFTIGDRVKITRDFTNTFGEFLAGHEFAIIDEHWRSNGELVFDLRDRDLNVLGEVPGDCLTLIRGT